MNTRMPFTDKVAPKEALRPGVLVPAIVVIAVALAGCTYSPAGDADPRSPSPGTPAADPAATRTPTSATTPIVIELDGQKIAGELDSSPASASLLAQLPLTLSFRDHGGQEKISELPAPLDLDGAPKGSDAAPLAIGYYVPEQSLVLYYEHVGYFNGIVPLGTYENSAAVRNQPDGFTVTIRKPD